jgi:hypothetical protein
MLSEGTTLGIAKRSFSAVLSPFCYPQGIRLEMSLSVSTLYSNFKVRSLQELII